MQGTREILNQRLQINQKNAAGTAGSQGPKGSQGPSGVKGSQGPSGAKGSQGPSGAKGSQGSTGKGTQGPIGTQGKAGFQGTRGDAGGATGAKGSQGPIGTTGLQGPAGPGLSGLLSSLNLSSTMVKTYTPTVTAGIGLEAGASTGNYLDLAGFKVCWGTVTFTWTNAAQLSGSCIVSFPESLFNSTSIAVVNVVATNMPSQMAVGTGYSTDDVQFNMAQVSLTPTTGISATVGFFAIGA